MKVEYSKDFFSFGKDFIAVFGECGEISGGEIWRIGILINSL